MKTLEVERADSDECGFLGYRLTAQNGDTLILFADVLPGFRGGIGFVPGITETISYSEVYLTAK